ncbi:MAG TPA: dTDP-4-dehydrorhamnose reductase [Candidatus Binatia bacterium]|nr:dTDP-4-dehydrorhamnose reductase [Candidatus Binatia bacterium]
MSRTILLTGSTGQVGADLARLLPGLGTVVAPDRRHLDLANPESIRRTVRDVRPQLIVNAAAYTHVDRAESDQATAYAVNAQAPGLLAEEASMIRAGLVHFSTDYVFDGLKTAPYVESDTPNPINTYGRSKLAGEHAIQGSAVPYLILRTSWVYSPRGRNFLLTVLKLSAEQEELRIVSDQIGAPTSSRALAVATVQILGEIGRRGASKESFAGIGGIYHMTAGGQTSWHGFAQAILQEHAGASQEIPWIAAATSGRPRRTRSVTAISTGEYPTPARRPAYSVLSNARLHDVFGVHLPDWRTQLRDVFQCPL